MVRKGNIQLEQLDLGLAMEFNMSQELSCVGIWGSGMLSVVPKRKCDTLEEREQEQNTSLAILLYS